jgi:hypothetical protein
MTKGDLPLIVGFYYKEIHQNGNHPNQKNHKNHSSDKGIKGDTQQNENSKRVIQRITNEPNKA